MLQEAIQLKYNLMGNKAVRYSEDRNGILAEFFLSTQKYELNPDLNDKWILLT